VILIVELKPTVAHGRSESFQGRAVERVYTSFFIEFSKCIAYNLELALVMTSLMIKVERSDNLAAVEAGPSSQVELSWVIVPTVLMTCIMFESWRLRVFATRAVLEACLPENW
jgi:hypothetical protein